VERLTGSAGLDAETWTVHDAKHTEVWVTHREEYEKRVSRFLAPRLGGDVAPPAGEAPAANPKPAAARKPAPNPSAPSAKKRHGAP
jgi:hypothetical protein